MKAGARIGAAAAAVAVAAALLVTLYWGARTRALVSHCRNNLRHLGGIAGRNWQNIESPKPGRLFWQDVRQAQYLDLNGRWAVPATEPFTCPVVHHGVKGKPDDPGSIDYLGPARPPRDPRKMPKAEPIGADRPGNHSSGGLVLRLDTSVDDLTPSVDSVGWEEAIKGLKD